MYELEQSVKTNSKKKELCNILWKLSMSWSNSETETSQNQLKEIEEELNSVDWLTEHEKLSFYEYIQNIYFLIMKHNK